MVNHRMQLQKYEEELARSRDRFEALTTKFSAAMGEVETGKQAAKEEVRVSKTKAEEAAAKAVYLEDVLGKQRVEMERIMHDYRYPLSHTHTHTHTHTFDASYCTLIHLSHTLSLYHRCD